MKTPTTRTGKGERKRQVARLELQTGHRFTSDFMGQPTCARCKRVFAAAAIETAIALALCPGDA